MSNNLLNLPPGMTDTRPPEHSRALDPDSPERIEPGSYELDREGSILFINLKDTEGTRRSIDHLIGRQFWSLFSINVRSGINTRLVVTIIPTGSGCIVDVALAPDDRSAHQEELDERKSYLLKLSDALRPLSDPNEIQRTACRILGEHLKVSRVLYGDVVNEKMVVISNNYVSGVPPITGTVDVADFGEKLISAYKRLEKVIINDVRTDHRYSQLERDNFEAISVRANASMGLIKEGIWVAAFGMHHNAPKEWSRLEIALMEDTGERTWAALERTRAEEALRESEERLQLSLKCANIFTWEVNRETGETKYSDNCDEVLGFKIRTNSADNFITIHPEDKDAVLDAIGLALNGTGPLDIEHRVIHPVTGEIIWIRAQGKLVDRRGYLRPVLIGITENITARKQAEDILRQNEMLLASVFKILPVGVGISDTEGKIIGHNEEMARFLTFSPDGSVLMSDQHRRTLDRHRSEEVSDIELQVGQNGENEIWTRIARVPLRNVRQETIGAVTVVTDIDELKRTAESLREHEKRLTELIKLRDEFIGIASHELKTPVTSLKAYAQLMQRKLEDIGDEQDRFVLARLNVQVDRLTTLINHLLDTTRISQGQLLLNMERVDVANLLQDRVDEIRLTTTHQFILELSPLPEVRVDRERIGQVITNLLSNAVKYSPAKSQVRIAGSRIGDVIQIVIHDEGFGIRIEDQSKIFERFYRCQAVTSDTVSGMGLGLYIAAQIVERHGGTLRVESEWGKGSRFYFALPIQ